MEEDINYIKILLEVASEYENGDINELKNNLLETNKVIVSLTSFLDEEKIQIEFWKEHFEILLVKYSFHSSLLLKIIEGTQIIDLENRIVVMQDISSLRIIARVMIENYLTIYDLFFSPKSNSEGEMRFYLYELSGLTSRQKFEAKNHENIIKKEIEKNRIAEIQELLKVNEYFMSLESKYQKATLSGKSSREISWEKLIEKSDIQSKLFRSLWRLFSNTAHSELLGAIQLKETIKNGQEKEIEEIFTTLFSCVLLNSCLIVNFLDLYPNSKRIFKNNSTDLYNKINVWSKLAKYDIEDKLENE